MDRRGGSDLEIRRRIEITRSCMTLLDRHIWRSPISLDTKIRLYRAYILPVLLYGSGTWTTTKEVCRHIDSFDCWCLWKILNTKHVTNAEVRQVTQCQPASPRHGASQQTALLRPRCTSAANWSSSCHHRPGSDHHGRPSSTWLRVIADDVHQIDELRHPYHLVEGFIPPGGTVGISVT